MLKTSEWKPLKRAYDYLKMQEFELRIEKEPTAAEEGNYCMGKYFC